MTISMNIKKLREKYNLTQADLGEIAGVSDKAVSTWESGAAEPRMGAIQKIADHFNIRKSDIIEDSPSSELPKDALIINTNRQVPILGRISAGQPIFAEQNVEGYTLVDSEKIDFALIVKGDSMVNARIHEGDLVLVTKDTDYANGDIVVALIDNEDATIKRYFSYGNEIVLRPENPKHNEQVYKPNEVKLLGKVIEVKIKL